MFNFEFQAIKPVGNLHPVQLHAALPNSNLSGSFVLGLFGSKYSAANVQYPSLLNPPLQSTCLASLHIEGLLLLGRLVAVLPLTALA